MRYFPDDNYGVDENHIDPLTRARTALDFEAFAASAPPVRDILFKAQTMGPLPVVRQSWQPRPAAFAMAMCALLLLAPWLPIRSSFTVMQIGFEKTMPRTDADKLSAHLMRNQPRNVLLQSEFKPADPDQTGYNVPGHLRIHLTAFNSSEPKIESTFKDLMRNYQGRKLDPLFTVDQNVATSGLHSPALMAYALLKDHAPRVLHIPDQSQVLAQLARKSQPLLANAVAPKIENIASGLKVKDVQFTSQTDGAGFSFKVPAWPEPVNFQVDGFEALDGERKSRVMSAAADWVRSSNLGVSAAEIIGDVPLQVTVYGLDTEVDPILTGKVQSWVQQPEDGSGLTDGAAEELIAKAMQEALPGQAYAEPEFERLGDRLFAKIFLERFRRSLLSKPVDEAADETDTNHGEY